MNPIVLSIPIFFFLILLELGWSLWKGKKLYRLGDSFANIGCGILEQLTGLFVKVFTVALYSYVYQEFRFFTLPTTWPWLVLLFLGVDFCYYWAHRMSHEVNLFWVGHVVHHQSEDYNLSVALRQGALQKIFTSPFSLPLALLGFNDKWFLLISAFNTLYQFWIHTELIRKFPSWFEFIFNTPSHHRVHHGRNEQYIDKNHGGSLIIWDRLFGTFAPEEEKVQYGITSPVASWNPVKAHMAPIKELFLQLKKGRGDWWNVLFRSPTWLFHNRPEIALAGKGNRDFGYDTSYPKSLIYYLIFQFLILIAATALFLFTIPDYDIQSQLLIVSVLLGQFIIISKLFEGGSPFSIGEFIRLALIVTLFHFLLSLSLFWSMGLFAFLITLSYLMKEAKAVAQAI